MDIVKYMMSFELLTKMSVQFYYQCIQAVKIFLTPKSVLPLVENVNGDDARSKSLDIYHLDVIWVYTAFMKEPAIFIRAASSFVKSPNTEAPFHTTIFYISAKIFAAELRAVFFDHLTDSAFEVIEVFCQRLSHMRTASNTLMQKLFKCMRVHNDDPPDRKEDYKARSEGTQCWIIQKRVGSFLKL